MIYYNRKDLVSDLAKTPKGQERQNILNIEHNRDLIKSSGANVMMYSGDVQESLHPVEALKNIHIGIIHRLNAKTAKPDGIGALGGLSERTNEEEFNNMTLAEKKLLLGKKDDVVLHNGKIALTNDIDIIRINNVIRETKEELRNLGIYDFHLHRDNIELIKMPDVKDDNFAINIWNGHGDVWCITPYCHTLKTDENTLDILAKRSEEVHLHENNSEAANFSKIKLLTALKSYGNYSGADKLEDGRNANTDYRYPHEWLATWALASDLLEHDENKLFNLYKNIQAQTPWKISFGKAADKMGKDLNFVADVLHISQKVVQDMENLPSGSVFIKSNSNSI